MSGYRASIAELSTEPQTLDSSATSAEFTDLTPGEPYTFSIIVDSSDQSSEATTYYFYTVPNEPTFSSVSYEEEISLTLHPPDTGGCVVFNLCVSGSDCEVTSETDRQIDGLSPGTAHRVTLSCSCNDPDIGRCESSLYQAELYTKPLTTDITGMTATGTSVTITWGRNSEYRYNIEVLADGSVVDSSSSLSDGSYTTSVDLIPGTLYTVKLYTTFFDESSDPSEDTIPTVPDSPSNLYVGQATITRNSFYISWQSPVRGAVSGYRVHANGDSHDVTSTGFSLTGLAEDTEYDVQVFSISNGVESQPALTSARTLDANSVGVGLAVTTTTITVTWDDYTNDGLENYILQLSHGGNTERDETISAGTSEYTFEDLHPGRTYVILLKIQLTADRVIDTQSATVTTEPLPVISVGDDGDVAETSMTLAIRADDNGDHEGFDVTYSYEGGTSLDIRTVNTAVRLSDLRPGATYTIRVATYAGDKSSQPIVIRSTTLPLPLDTLESTRVSDTSVMLSWTVYEESQQNFFFIQYKRDTDSSWNSREELGTSVEIVDLNPGCHYNFRVHAVSGGNTEVDGSETSISDLPYPKDVTDVSASSIFPAQIDVAWDYDDTGSCWSGFALSVGGSVYHSTADVRERSIGDLIPGETYDVSLAVYANDVDAVRVPSQHPAETPVTVMPRLSTSLAYTENGQGTDFLQFTFTPNDVGTFDDYYFNFAASGRDPLVKSRTDIDYTVRFGDLTPGAPHNITVFIRSGDVDSSVGTFYRFTRPMQPVLSFDAISNDYLVLKLTTEGLVEQYRVTCALCPTGYQSVNLVNGIDVYNYTGLEPYQTYTFDAIAISNELESQQSSIDEQTSQRAPGPVQDFVAIYTGCGEVQLSWSPPSQRNGVIRGYLVNATAINGGERISKQYAEDKDGDKIEDLNIGSAYEFYIYAETIAYGEPSGQFVQITTSLCVPHKDILDQDSKPLLQGNSSYNSFKLKLTNPFSNTQGDISKYKLLVMRKNSPGQPSANDFNGEPMKWSDIESTTGDYIYQPFPDCNDFGSFASGCEANKRRRRSSGDTIDVQIGVEPCDGASSAEFCNGPLQPMSDYYVALRAYTVHGDYYEHSGISNAIQTGATPTEEPSDGGTPSWIIIVAVIVVIILLVAVVFAVLYVKRRGPFKDPTGRTNPSMGMKSGGSFISKRSVRRTPNDYRRPVKIADFLKHVSEMSADTDYKFSLEYEALTDVGHDGTQIKASEKAENRNKNRFTNILPYDHTRVKLLATDDEDGTDYINANYMPGHNSMREFIVTQGCLPSTTDDFWRMVWEQNCSAIVMLTRCMEKARDKCQHYWPVDAEPMFYGDLQVVVLNETKCPEWTVTEFRISEGEYARNIKHFHYTVWPDFGTPEKPQSLLKFVRLVRSKLRPEAGPTIVHCSAGVGRSGTFIAIDRLLQQVKAGEDSVDIFYLVAEMRFHRRYMVQTEGQYVCIHRCLACVLAGQEDDPYNLTGEDNDGYEDDEGITDDLN